MKTIYVMALVFVLLIMLVAKNPIVTVFGILGILVVGDMWLGDKT